MPRGLRGPRRPRRSGWQKTRSQGEDRGAGSRVFAAAGPAEDRGVVEVFQGAVRELNVESESDERREEPVGARAGGLSFESTGSKRAHLARFATLDST